MLCHRDIEGGQLARTGVGDLGGQRPVDDTHRQVPKEIDDPRLRLLMARGHERVQQAFDPGPHAAKAPGRGEQG